jgi:hypothetical protein
MILERRRMIRSWYDRAIVPGYDWSLVDEHLRTADVVLLISIALFLLPIRTVASRTTR